MFGIGMTELVVILVIALLIFGPNKLPELARSLGKGFGEFRRASYDLRQSLMEAGDLDAPPDTQHTPAPEAGAPASPRPDQANAPPPPQAEPEMSADQSKPSDSATPPKDG